MARVPVFHVTPVVRLPMIEEEGLRTRADLSGLFGPPEEFDQAAPGVFANGRRISAWVHREQAEQDAAQRGPGLVTWDVDPAKSLAGRAATRESESPRAYWAVARPLAEWQAEGDLPDDLEVHVNVGVRTKFLQLLSPLASEAQLGMYAPLVAAVADEDRLSAKALMHLAIIACEEDFESPAFVAACALAWRDAQDPASLTRELLDFGADKVASAALAEFGGDAPEATARLREVLETTREFADDNGFDHGQGVIGLTSIALAAVPRA